MVSSSTLHLQKTSRRHWKSRTIKCARTLGLPQSFNQVLVAGLAFLIQPGPPRSARLLDLPNLRFVPCVHAHHFIPLLNNCRSFYQASITNAANASILLLHRVPALPSPPASHEAQCSFRVCSTLSNFDSSSSDHRLLRLPPVSYLPDHSALTPIFNSDGSLKQCTCSSVNKFQMHSPLMLGPCSRR